MSWANEVRHVIGRSAWTQPGKSGCPLRLGIGGGGLLAAIGAAETQAFQDQSQSYVRHWSALGGEAHLVQLSGRHHYDILCDLMQKRSELVDRFQQFIVQT